MLRSTTRVLAATALVAAAACSSNGQAGCSQPPVQQYPTPTLVTPAAGSSNVSDSIRTIQISTQTAQIIGTITLVTPGGQTLNVGKARLDPQQPNPNAYLWDVNIPALAAHTTYTVTQTITYPGACLGPNIVQSHAVGTFSTQ